MVNMQPAFNVQAAYKASLAFVPIAFQSRLTLALPTGTVKDSLRAVGLVLIPTPRIAENTIRRNSGTRGAIDERSALQARVCFARLTCLSKTLAATPSLASRAVSGRNGLLADLARITLSACDALTRKRAKTGIGAFGGRVEINRTDFALLNCPEPSAIDRTIISGGFSNQRGAFIEWLGTPETHHDHGPIILNYCQLAQRRIEAVTKQGLLFA